MNKNECKDCCEKCKTDERKKVYDKCLNLVNMVKFQCEDNKKITIIPLILSLSMNIIVIAGLVINFLIR